MHAQLRIVAEERNAITKEERQNMERLLITISGSIHKDLPQLFEETLHQEMAGATASLAGAVKASITEVMPKDLLGSGFQVRGLPKLQSMWSLGLASPGGQMSCKGRSATSLACHCLPLLLDLQQCLLSSCRRELMRNAATFSFCDP